MEYGQVTIFTLILFLLFLLTFFLGFFLPAVSDTFVAETAAMVNTRAIHNACQSYRVNYGFYPENLSVLIGNGPGYIDTELANGSTKDYLFSYSRTDNQHFRVNADPDPRSANQMRGKHFYIDETGITHVSVGQREAQPVDPVLQ